MTSPPLPIDYLDYLDFRLVWNVGVIQLDRILSCSG